MLDRQAITEQKMAELLQTYGADNPEVKRVRAGLDATNRQIDDRLDGILQGLKARAAAEKARLDNLQAELDKTKTNDAATAIQRRPYFQARHQLENLEYIRDKLAMRIIQEKTDAALPKQP